MAFKLFDNVMESSTTTGTGYFTLAGAITGFSTFSSRYSTGDMLYYAIKEVDAAGGPSGAWEVGIGTYSAANTLTRTTVLSSSNSDAAVNFASGTKRVFVTLVALQGNSIREKLTAARTYYVRTDGSDSNTGLANTSGGAFLTIQKAIDVVAQTIDLGAYSVTIQVADGTYTASVTMRPYIGTGAVTIQGNSTTPANVVLSTTSAHCINNSSRSALTVKDVKIQTTTSGYGVVASNGGLVSINNVDFGACANGHMYIDTYGRVTAAGSYAISGSAPAHVIPNLQGSFTMNSGTVTLTGTPAFSSAFLYCSSLGFAYINGVGSAVTFSGSATGKKYDVLLNSVVNTGGSGTNYLPGDSAGTTSSGGLYN